ncbi:hypothetical protein BC628DRAFT_1418371 [Trametes gibbosa]|nr:hypothetical protein BC628DRAFT_1418371 [Trametes gibbosa]
MSATVIDAGAGHAGARAGRRPDIIAVEFDARSSSSVAQVHNYEHFQVERNKWEAVNTVFAMQGLDDFGKESVADMDGIYRLFADPERLAYQLEEGLMKSCLVDATGEDLVADFGSTDRISSAASTMRFEYVSAQEKRLVEDFEPENHNP